MFPPQSRSKYGNHKTTVVSLNRTFDSKAEAAHAIQLAALEATGQISDLEYQPRFPVFINGIRIFTYVADFAYTEDGERVVVDVKGLRTPLYTLKKKAVEAYYDLVIKEVRA